MFVGYDFGLLFPIAALVLVVALVVVITRRNLANGTAFLTARRLVEGYVFTVILVAMLLVSSGLGDIIRAGFARWKGIEYSYRPQPVYDEPRKPEQGPRYEYDMKAPRRDFLGGVAQFGIGVIVGVLHFLGLRRLERSEPLRTSPVYRLFLILGLVIYTTIVIVAAVASVKDWLIYKYVGLPPMPSWSERPIPGDQIAGLIGFLPFWILLVQLLFRYARSRNAPITNGGS